jgi:hypothetical protein
MLLSNFIAGHLGFYFELNYTKLYITMLSIETTSCCLACDEAVSCHTK